MGAARTLRVAVLGIKVPEARRYHVSVQVLAKGQAPAGVVALDGSTFDLRPDQVARTETTPLEANPMFLNRVFVMRLPESLEASPSILLHCNLFATPTLGTSNAGAIVAGKEVDELVGAATLQIGGDLAARLLRGERCTLPAVLGSGAAEDNGGVRDAIALASMFGARATREVLLELMLLDAHLTLPRDAPMYPAPTTHSLSSISLAPADPLASLPTATDASVGGGLGAAVAKCKAGPGLLDGLSPSPCKLQVLVVRAENLPTVRDSTGAEVAPDTFVSAASLHEVRSRAIPKAVTSTAAVSQNPVWGQVLEVEYAEQELAQEEVCLGIVNDGNSRLMLKASIPLDHLLPSVHYNLKVTMPGGLLGSSVVLYVTLCLVDCFRMEYRQLQRVKPPLSHVVEARLASCSQQLDALVAAANPPESNAQYCEVLGVWKVKPSSPVDASNHKANEQASKEGSSNAHQSPLEPVRVADLYTHVDVSKPAEMQKTLQALADNLAASVQQPYGASEVLPLQTFSRSSAAGKQGELLWGPDHMVSLIIQEPQNATLHLELHAIGSKQSVSLPLARILLPLPRVGGSMLNADIRSSRSSTTHNGLPLQACSIPGSTCNMEACLWQLASYLEHLHKAMPPLEAGIELSSSLQDPKSMLSQMSWQALNPSQNMPGLRLDQQKLDQTAGVKDVGGRASAAILEALVDDLLMKQVAIERISRQQDTTEARSEIVIWRVADAEQRNQTLLQENQRLRQLLHEDRESQKGPPLLEDSPNLSREQLVERTETALAAYSRERRRNTELVHRLQQMHNEQVDVLEMKKRYQELQTAHMELGRAMSDPSTNQNKLVKFRATVKTQEEVISNLEALLAQALAKAKALPALEAKHKAAMAELDSIKRGPLIELDALKKGPLLELDWLRKEKQNARPPLPQGMAPSEVHEIRKAHAREVHDLRAQHAALEENFAAAADRNEMLVQETEWLKAKAEASREELIMTIKRYAEVISTLKWRLAEKDAQLMGGFGAGSTGTPPWMSHARAFPLATPLDHGTKHGQHSFSSISAGLPFVQVPTYSPTASSHVSRQPTPTRTPTLLSSPMPSPNATHRHRKDHQHVLHPPAASTRQSWHPSHPGSPLLEPSGDVMMAPSKSPNNSAPPTRPSNGPLPESRPPLQQGLPSQAPQPQQIQQDMPPPQPLAHSSQQLTLPPVQPNQAGQLVQSRQVLGPAGQPMPASQVHGLPGQPSPMLHPNLSTIGPLGHPNQPLQAAPPPAQAHQPPITSQQQQGDFQPQRPPFANQQDLPPGKQMQRPSGQQGLQSQPRPPYPNQQGMPQGPPMQPPFGQQQQQGLQSQPLPPFTNQKGFPPGQSTQPPYGPQQAGQQFQPVRLSDGNMPQPWQQPPLQPSNPNMPQQVPPMGMSNGAPQSQQWQQQQQRASSADLNGQSPTSPVATSRNSVSASKESPLDPNAIPLTKLPSMQRQGVMWAPGSNGVPPGSGAKASKPPGPGMPPLMGQILQAAWPRKDSPGSRG